MTFYTKRTRRLESVNHFGVENLETSEKKNRNKCKREKETGDKKEEKLCRGDDKWQKKRKRK